MMSEVMVKKMVPVLRFGEFQEEWKVKNIGNCATKVGSGSTPRGGEKVYTKEGIPFIRSQNVTGNKLVFDKMSFIPKEIDEQMKGSRVRPFDILLNITGASIGRSCVVPEDFESGNVNQHVSIIRLKEEYSPFFFQPFLSSFNGQKAIMRNQVGSGREGLNFQSIRSLKINAPTFPEQKKIATFLTTIDTRLQQLAEKKTLLEQYKKGVMQQIFSQEVRFRDEEGKEFPKWRNRKLSELLSSSKARNREMKFSKKEVLSVSGEAGIVNQIEFMGRSYAGASVANYHIVEHGNIVYTKSPLKANPYGIIKVNKGVAGIVSTLYAVYKVKKKEALGLYLDFYFELDDNLNRYLRPLVRKGAKNDMKINNDYVLIDKISIPGVQEQQKIVDFFTALDQRIKRVGEQITEMEQYKKGLLQQMFV